MIIYNVTIKVDWSIHDEWLNWMKENHIPDMISIGLFVESLMVRLLMVDESDGPTYAVQYYANSLDDYNQFIEEWAPFQSDKEFSKWGSHFVNFTTIMEVVQ